MVTMTLKQYRTLLLTFLANVILAEYQPSNERGTIFNPNSNWPIKSKDNHTADWSDDSPWPSGTVLGQVSGVTLDSTGIIYIFHRGDHVWNMKSFNNDNLYEQREEGPIRNNTILLYHPNGTLVKARGSNMFYLPHGITVDRQNNIWVTDVALHQIMKLSPSSDSPTLTLGEPFIPGRDSKHFCKPTSVAITADGDFFVADGYCNSRILKFSSSGTKLLEWGRSTVNIGLRKPDVGEFMIPHALTIAEDKGLVCVADRENGRIQCFHIRNGSFALNLSDPQMGSRLFSVSYSSANGGMFFAVNGPQLNNNLYHSPIKVFVFSMDGVVINQFGSLQNPHDLAVTPDGHVVYVAELDPHVVHRFTMNHLSRTASQASVVSNPLMATTNDSEVGGIAGAAMLTSACLIFAAAILIAAFVYSKSKSSGYGQCPSNRWHLKNGSAEGFKLGNILGHQGFAKLNGSEETDEEQPLA